MSESGTPTSAEVRRHAEGEGDACPSCRIGLWSPGHVHYTDAEHCEHITHVAAGADPVAFCILCAPRISKEAI